MKRPDKVEHSWMNEAEVERYVTDLEKYCDWLEEMVDILDDTGWVVRKMGKLDKEDDE
jgi:hypothetical protein